MRRLPRSVELDDLVQAGAIGLLNAIDKYDSARNRDFRKYARIRINGAILDELRGTDYLSRTLRKRQKKIEDAEKELQKEGVVEHDDVARTVGISRERYDEARQLTGSYHVCFTVDLDEEESNHDPDIVTLVSSPEDIALIHANTKLVHTLLAELPDRLRTVLELYYIKGLNLEEIGKIIGVTASRASQIHTQAVSTLRRRVKHVDRCDEYELEQRRRSLFTQSSYVRV